mmetsp:Transcript_6622/g.6205  ORF Transcript_6622/g.6205 Transcript_6622/m.6205 type:complete len:99 (-) Transcript_6622:405-701(-)
MKRSESYRRKREIINQVENKKSLPDRLGPNLWKMTLRAGNEVRVADLKKIMKKTLEEDKSDEDKENTKQPPRTSNTQTYTQDVGKSVKFSDDGSLTKK